ncbi:hypothetical protein CcrSwift_gp322 [Caulobacter phage CcrSwift]|uniref:Uncharacterized protein n=1 Tax=Caulobacter phage CcrSwift TaxID=2927984 RepID=K4JW37_9CAUD|nr:hypothetical protein D870_gp099 [Caulobacter phage CcrSwift]AFU88640.1 hypothetical protein CcrSwift_gp322 [Caulobacter phage CcrSwift]
MTQPQYLTRQALFRRRQRGDIWPVHDEMDYAASASTVVDDPREPSIVPTGVLDAAGEMLLKVHMPIKVPLGFAIPPVDRDDADEVVSYVPESQLIVSDIGLGRGYVTPEEADAGEIDGHEAHEEHPGQASIRIPATKEVIAAHGAMGEAAERVADQVTALHVDLTPEGIIVLRGLIAAQGEALIAFLQAAHTARAEGGEEDEDEDDGPEEA